MLKQSIGLFSLLLLMVTLIPTEAFGQRFSGKIEYWMNMRNGETFVEIKDNRSGKTITFSSHVTHNFDALNKCMTSFGDVKDIHSEEETHRSSYCEIDYKRKGKDFSINWATPIP